jgi:hypothetical protein
MSEFNHPKKYNQTDEICSTLIGFTRIDARLFKSHARSNTKTTSKNYSENQTRAKVAKYVSLHGKKISHATLATAEKVYDAAQQEPATFGQIWTDLNSEKISPNKAYKNMQRIQTRQNQSFEPQPSTTKGTDYDDNSKEVIAKSTWRDVTECDHCQIKDFRIKELEDAVRKTTQLTPANQISEVKDDKIKQLHKGLDLEPIPRNSRNSR